jgi:hypothetical protein
VGAFLDGSQRIGDCVAEEVHLEGVGRATGLEGRCCGGGMLEEEFLERES